MGPKDSSQTNKDRKDGLDASSTAEDTKRNRYFVNLAETSHPHTFSIAAIMDRKEHETPRLMKFSGRKVEEYNLWRQRVVFAFKRKKYWKYIKEEKCTEEMRDDACALLVGALGNVPFRVFRRVDSRLAVLKLLDQQYASSTSAAIIGLIGQVYSKRFTAGKPMATCIDE